MTKWEGRYRLSDARVDADGVTRWAAHDDVLDMSVDVLTLPETDPRAARLVATARAAGAVTDPRLQHVVDAGVAPIEGADGPVAYVVHRHPSGRTLSDLVAGSGLDPLRAAHVAADVALALGSAHRAGLGHGGLTPDLVVVDDQTTTILGLGVVAALTGRPTSVRGDTRAVAATLYAALTGRFPDVPEVATCATLPPAPTSEDAPVRPRLVRAGVSGPLDEITARALGLPKADPVIDDLDQFAAELHRYLAEVHDQQLRRDQRVTAPPDWPWSRLAGLAAVTLIVVGAGLAGYQAWNEARQRAASVADVSPSTTSSATPTPSATPVPVTKVTVVDPQGDGVENDAQTSLAVDGDPTTSWTTLDYASRDLGGLKDGVGLRLDLGGLTTVTAIRLQLVGRGSDLTVYSADNPAPARRGQLAGFTPVLRVRGVGDAVTLPLTPPVNSRALIIWLTGLPSNGSGYSGGVAEVTVFGE
jgi:putative peptidoglycan lipid II flippase